MNYLKSVPMLLRLAFRSLSRRPGLSILAIVTLGLGIGANTAIFSIVNVVLLKPLPFANSDRLVVVQSTGLNRSLAEGFASYPDFHDWSEQSAAFKGMAAFWTFPNGDVNLTGGTEPQRVSVARVTTGFFEVLGIAPLHGRTFQADESIVGNHRRAILSYSLWQRQFAADPTLVGRSVTVNGFPYTVVGIMSPAFQARSVRVLGTHVDLWRPLVPEDNQTGGRDDRKLRVVGRLADSVTLTQAEGELAGVASRLALMYPETNRDAGIRLVPLREQIVRDVRRGLLLLFGAVGIVLLSACVNVANLLLVKAAASRTALAVQHSLGASQGRIAAQVLTESLLLGGAGAALGLLLGFGGVKVFVALGPQELPLLTEARIDGAVLIFTLLAALATVLLVGLVPAWRSARAAAPTILRQGGNRSQSGEDRRALRLLTVAQIALAMVLLPAGGLLLRSFQALLRVDPGLDPARVLTFQLELPMATTYPTQAAREAFFANLLVQVEGIPGVQGASLASAPPLEEDQSQFTFTRPGGAETQPLQATLRMVAPNYFSILGIPLLGGRPFLPGDERTAPRVVIVSETLARSVWGTESPIGARIAQPFGEEAEVVGVAGDVRTSGLDGEPGRTVYLPAGQGTYNFMTVVVKSRNDPRGTEPAIRGLIKTMDPSLPLHHVRTVADLLTASVAPQRFQTVIVGGFALLVFLLAIIGTYGVASYGVSERTGELGIRMALGATGGDIKRLVLREGALLALFGIVLGGIGAVALSRLLSRFVFQVSALDLVTFSITPLILALAMIAATFIPAHRATRIDPMRALRSE